MTRKPKSQRRGDWNSPTTAWSGSEPTAEPGERGLKSARYVDWKPRLVDYLAWAVRQPFVFGQFDCALFTFGAVGVMTGIDPGGPYRGGYSTLRDGIALLRQAGHRDHLDVCALYFEEIPVSFAQAGDIAVVPGDDGPALGLVQGEHIYALAPSGMSLVPLLSATRAFKVA